MPGQKLSLKPGQCCQEMTKFNDSLSGLQFNVSDGDVEGKVIVYPNAKHITFNDGYRDYPYLELKYCPFCGQERK